MKYIPVILLLLLAGYACSPSQALTDQEIETAEETTVSDGPAWYRSAVHSDSDTLSFYGYSMVSSYNENEAVSVARETAFYNLRFEIDSFAEKARIDLADEPDGERYRTPEFILTLRNAVRDTDLQDGDVTIVSEKSETGIYVAYARAAITLEAAKKRFADRLNDLPFLDRMFDPIQKEAQAL